MQPCDASFADWSAIRAPVRARWRASVPGALRALAKTDEGFRLTTMELGVVATIPGIDPEKFIELAEAAKLGCPVSNALAGNVEILLNASLA